MARSLTQNASSDDFRDGRRPDVERVRIVIADELPIFRDGLRLLLGADARLQVVGGADVGPAVDRLVRDLQPDILLLGYLSSGTPVVEMLKRLAASGISVRTILLVKSIDTPEIVEALHFGACGVLARHSAAELLFKSIDVQRLLSDRMGTDIFFYSISIDPEWDTPAVLREYAEKFHAGPGWLFLTGKAADITAV